MSDEDDHVAAVDVWRATLSALPAAAVLTAFERAFSAIWRRAHTTLGDVTLTAIGDRVFHDANERFPRQLGCRLEADGLDAQDLRRRLDEPGFDRDKLVDHVTFVLVELLTVVGVLTAEVLSPALHQALAASSGPTDDTDDTNDTESDEKDFGE